ncbi:cadherin repeat domain-containing protein [Candidatus Gracilibacteria bacterium]|nr:cadherin repeat domain-containing protein [Candidatus Gracilibacteria bacterium]
MKINCQKAAFLSVFLVTLVSLGTINNAKSFFGDDASPTGIVLSEQLVNENSPDGSLIGTLSASDPDNSINELTFFLTNDAGGRFAIVNKNQLQVANGNMIDYESDRFHTITIFVRDPDWNGYEKDFPIIVNNLNEPPSDINFYASDLIEGDTRNKIAGTLEVIDPDDNDLSIFELVDDAGGRFKIENGTTITTSGEIELVPPGYLITVSVMDAMRNSLEKTFSVSINPIDAPIITDLTIENDDPKNTMISWAIDREDIRAQIEYGINMEYGNTTRHAYVLNQEQRITFPELLSCTTYDYRIHFKDTLGKESVDKPRSFTTGNCAGGARILSQSRKEISTALGGQLPLVDKNDFGIKLDIPPSFVGEDISAEFQVKKLQKASVLSETKSPEDSLYILGSHIYDIKALDTSFSEVFGFQKKIRMTITYSQEIVSILDEDTIRIFSWDGNFWQQLPQCHVDPLNNTVSCGLDHFSTYAAFGKLNDLAKKFNRGTKTIRRAGMDREAYHDVAREAETVTPQNFDRLYEQSLEEIEDINRGLPGSAQKTIDRFGNEVFEGYKSGKLAPDEIKRMPRGSSYRGGGSRH